MKEQIDAMINNYGNLMDYHKAIAATGVEKHRVEAAYYEGCYDASIQFRTFLVSKEMYLPAKKIAEMVRDNKIIIDMDS
jgi:hypothetical protein